MVEANSSDRLVILVRFNDHLITKEVTIGSAEGAINITTGTIIVRLNEVQLLYSTTNSVLSGT